MFIILDDSVSSSILQSPEEGVNLFRVPKASPPEKSAYILIKQRPNTATSRDLPVDNKS